MTTHVGHLRQLGPGGPHIPIIGQGTWQMERDERKTVLAAVRRGVELGLTHIDTAEMYGSGQVEELLGEALEGLRDRVFLVSKVLPSNGSWQGTLRACERSLRRLRTDHLDLYLLHWPGSHPLEQTFGAFEQLVQEGKIRAWGVSNFDERELEQAVSVAGEHRIACNQVLHHLKCRAIEHAVVPWCERHGIAVVGYSPFGSGNFPSPTSPAARVLQAIAQAHGATPRQVALRFLISRDGMFTVPKASHPQHVADNAAALQWQLDEEEITRIDRAFPLGPKPRILPMI